MRITINKLTEDFIVECSTSESVDEVTRRVCEINNIRLRVRRLVGSVRNLIAHGPMKHPDKWGLSDEQLNIKGDGLVSKPGDCPLGQRVGKPCDPTVAKTLESCCVDAEMAVSNELAKRRQPTDMAKIQECVMNIKGAVMMAYPMGLPEWDFVRLGIEGTEDLSGMEDSKHVVEPDEGVLWFAGKAMIREQMLSKYVGTNDKCIIKAKLEKKGASAPQREPAVDEETRRAMIARYHKKQEQEKALAEDDDDAYANSVWANPKEWKNNISGATGGVKFRP
jgi:hypothetical protein